MKHTPGPWSTDWGFIVAPDPSGEHDDVYIAEIVTEDSEGRAVPQEQQDANAQLLAAAPTMRKFIEQIARMTTDKEMDGDMSGDDAVSALSGLIEEARDLIGG